MVRKILIYTTLVCLWVNIDLLYGFTQPVVWMRKFDKSNQEADIDIASVILLNFFQFPHTFFSGHTRNTQVIILKSQSIQSSLTLYDVTCEYSGVHRVMRISKSTRSHIIWCSKTPVLRTLISTI